MYLSIEVSRCLGKTWNLKRGTGAERANLRCDSDEHLGLRQKAGVIPGPFNHANSVIVRNPVALV